MSLDDRRGINNAAKALRLAIQAGYPAKIATWNAANGPELHSKLKGTSGSKYVFGVDSVLNFTYNKNSTDYAIAATITAGSYSAAELVTSLNADSDYNTHLTASERPDDHLRHQAKTSGVESSLIVGDGTAHAILATERASNFYLLDDFVQVPLQYDQFTVDYPYCRIDMPSGSRRGGAPSEIMMGYTLECHVYDTGDSPDELSQKLNAHALCLRDTIEQNPLLSGQVNGCKYHRWGQFMPLLGDDTVAMAGEIIVSFEVSNQEAKGV